MLPSSSAQLSPREAKRETDRRRLARARFLYFNRYVDSKFESPAHMELIAEKLEQVEKYLRTGGREGIGRLMILLPPRHGKSEMASRKFPAWVLGRLPDTRIIMASYGADLASKNSRAVRDLIEGKRYQALFGGLSSKGEPVELSSDSRSVSAWDLAQPHRGGVVAAGVGGGITGLGADLLILDDLFKNREEAESESRRELVDDWYKSSAYTRLEKEYSAIILFFTHWHPDDLVGRMLKRMVEDPMADQWEVVDLPALSRAECYASSPEEQRQKMRDGVYLPLADPIGRRHDGAALWPTRFGQEWLVAKEANIGKYDFAALYQQMPYLREGGLFKREWFTIVDRGPADEVVTRRIDGIRVNARVMAWDKAATPGGGARSSGVLMCKGKDGFYYVEHVAKGQWSSYQREQKMVDLGQQFYKELGPFLIRHPQDPGSAGVDSASVTNINLAEAGLEGHARPVSGEKEVRAHPYSTAAEAGRVRLVRGGWNDDYLDELASFPKGTFKDQVDASSDAFNGIIEIVNEPEIPEDEIVTYEERVSISPV
jgi:predicted phage terminase large subunit-like protein